jgi:hypothetical protein
VTNRPSRDAANMSVEPISLVERVRRLPSVNEEEGFGGRRGCGYRLVYQ